MQSVVKKKIFINLENNDDNDLWYHCKYKLIQQVHNSRSKYTVVYINQEIKCILSIQLTSMEKQ